MRTRRLQLECLEDRTLLSGVIVTSNTANLAANATTIVIAGTGFDPIVANNSVAFNDNAVGTVTAATATSLTVEFATDPTTAANLTAIVTSDSQSNASAVQVATVTPVVTSSAANLAADATTLVINGYGFDPTTPTDNTIVFNDGATGTVESASATSLTVTLSVTPTTAGSLTADVTTDTVDEGSAVQVATVTPVVTTSSATLAANSATLTIDGYGFDATAANNSVVLSSGVVGSISSASPTSLTVTLSTATTTGELTAVVTTDNLSSGVPVQVAAVTPVVTSSTADLAANAATITIDGYGFDPTAANNSVTFSSGAGTVTAATATTLTVTFTTAPTAGDLTAAVTTDDVSSGSAVQVATVTPVVTSSTANLAADATTVTIDGDGFDTTIANDNVTLSSGEVGSITSASATSLTVSFATGPTGGDLAAVVTTDSESSGSVPVATVTPVVTSSSTAMAANTATITIDGYGFDTNDSNDSVAFSNGAVGTISAATATSLTVSFTTAPTAGNLTAVVTTDSASSGAPVQVASVTPVVTSSTADLAANAATLTIDGYGFDPTAANNAVTLTDGAAGTVTAATPTWLTVTLTTDPTTAGSLSAIVTTDGQNSGADTQVATVTPVVTSSSASLPFNATTVTIYGYGFDTDTTNDSVTLDGGVVVGTVSTATPTSLTVTFTTPPSAVGSLTATVTIDTESSGSAVQVATVAPLVFTNSAYLLTANSTSVTIIGVGFDTNNANDSVTFNDGAVGTVSAATADSLTVSLSTPPATATTFFAVVTVDNVSSGAAVQVATVRPVVTSSISSLPANATTLTIDGYGFDPIAAHNTVTFNDGAVGTVTAATPTALTVTFSTKPQTAGNLTAVVTIHGVSNLAPVQVTTVTPVVTSSTANLAANATTLTINGFGFDPTASNNSVRFIDGAVGTVTAATTTSLTVTLSTRPAVAGSLTAVATTDNVSSGSAVQVATVTPVVVANSAYAVAANASTITINGFGFDTTAANNTVAFSNGAVGHVALATTTSLTVTLTTPPTAGSLTAIVTTDNVSSGSAVQVATVAPIVTSSASSLAANAATITIDGVGFDTAAAHDSVTFNDGAVGSVTAATATALTVTLSPDPTTAGNLTAVVTTDSVSSGAAVQVATVTPVVSNTTTGVAANAATLTIDGFGFDTTPRNNTVVFNDGAAGTVTAATATALTVTLSTDPTTAGSLTAVVTTDGISSGSAVQVAQVQPVVTGSTANLAANAGTIVIDGIGFDPTAAHDSVTFNDGAVGSVESATATSLTVTLSTDPTTAGSLTASVTTDSVSSGTAVQVATVTPVVTSSTAALVVNAGTITIAGYGFDATAANDSVTFNDGAAGNVAAATPTSLTVTITTPPTAVGNLTAVVTTDSETSGAAVQVATVSPVVTSSTAPVDLDAATLTINGYGFDTTAGNNTVTFNDGATGSVTAATANALTVTLFTDPTTGGSLTAVVTTDGVSSGSAVQVGAVTPVVVGNTANLPATASSITIDGFGFDTNANNDTVTFTDGAIGSVASATATSLTVTLTTDPSTAGSLTASVTIDGVSNGSDVQVATVTPVVTNSTASVAFNATTLTINGYGFDPNADNDTVVLGDGAAGTVTAATDTSLTVTLGTGPTAVGSLTATVTTDSQSSGAAVQVATVVPVVTSSTASLAANAGTITIDGFGFDPIAANNAVTFNNGAAGNVSAATATSLTVTLTTAPTAGNLTAAVTTDGVSSGTPVQVATVTPVVTGSAASLATTAATVVITGVGFDPTAANNTVVFSSGATGTVTTASLNSLTVTFTAPPTAGNLTAVVTTDSQSSGSAVQVATVTPVVTSSTGSLALNGTSLIINGYGFDTTAAHNTVSFNDGAAGTVAAATANALTVTLTTEPTAVGNLTAIVTTDGASSASEQVAHVVAAISTPTVTTSAAGLLATATALTINGHGFDTTTAANNRVILNDGAAGTVTAATATALTVTLSTSPTTAGSLTAVVITDGISSGSAVQVAAVKPVVTSSTASLLANATTLTINGFGFDPTPGNNVVVFNDGASGTVTAATATSLTVTFSTKPTTAGSLTVVVTTDSQSSGTAVQVATVVSVVTTSTANLGVNGTTFTINGYGFDPVAVHNTVAFNDGAIGTVTLATATALTVTFSTRPTALGSLTAVVTTDTHSSGAAVQVATVAPVVTGSTAKLAANAATITIRGFGFDTTAAHNTVTFNDVAVGSVTAATATSLTVTFTTEPTTAGSLTAVVTTDSVSSGAATQLRLWCPW